MPTVPFFEILALSGLFYPLSVVSYNVLKSRSDGNVIVRLEIVKRMIQTIILAVTIPIGVEAVAWGVTAMAAVEFMLNTGVAMRYLTTTLGSLLRALAPSFTLASLMFGALHIIEPHIAMLNIALRLPIMVGVGGAIYLLLAWVLRLRALGEGISVFRGMLNKGK